MAKRIKGISFLNPVNVEEGYLKYCADYAIAHGIGHFEIIGPTHDPVRGNCDGMILYRKYAEFNEGKDKDYIEYCTRVVNETLDKVAAHGIKSYYWHHELEVPANFDEVYPEIHNADGDVEVTHPRIRDFLENKIEDFFYTYPNMSGIVLTLHETRIPLLKLKNQKLGKVERVKYVTEIVYNTCKRLGKELIVRPFASLASDYNDLMSAYEQISHDLIVCDKWTQFDWSLTLPSNEFFHKIKDNPLMVETDIFGEYFGKGLVPIMLKDHIIRKFAYCEDFNPRGYVNRIDRGGNIPFGTPNEVNLEIMDAVEDGRDVDAAIDAFFAREYGEYGPVVRAAMDDTEELQIKAMSVQGFGIHWLSHFPGVFAAKSEFGPFLRNHVKSYRDWDFPKDIEHLDVEVIRRDQAWAISAASEKLELIKTLEGKFDEKKYYSLYMRFTNLYYVAKIWRELAEVYINLAKFFDDNDEAALLLMNESLDKIKELDIECYEILGDDAYCEALYIPKNFPNSHQFDERKSGAYHFGADLRAALDAELKTYRKWSTEGLCDFVIPGGFAEEHSLETEANFSAAIVTEDGVCRTAGAARDKEWSLLKAHGWFSYILNVRPGVKNTIEVLGKGQKNILSIDLAIDGDMEKYRVEGDGILSVVREFTPKSDKVVVRIDRNSEYMPFIYGIKIK